MENNNEEYEVYYEDNGFNPNGVQNASSDSISIPKTTSSNSQQNMNGFRTNSNNNLGPGSLALGQNKMNRNLPSNSSLDNDNGFPDKSNINNMPTGNNGSNTMPSTIPNANKDTNNTNNNNSLNNSNNNNSMPRVNNPNSGNNTTNKANDNASKPKEKPLGDNDKKGFDPRKGLSSLTPGGIANNIRSRLGLGKSNNDDSNDNSDSNGNTDKTNDLKQKSMLFNLLTNPKYRVVVLSGGGFIILLFGVLLFIIIIVALTTTTASNLSCDSPSYAVNSSNATEFLCNMQSPFNGNGYTVTGVSGWRIHPATGGVKFHEGTDVVGKDGASQKIYAVADGTVEVAGLYGGYGNAVKINHNGQFTSLYGHMSAISSEAKAALKNKTEIKAGTFIGIQGSTGISTGVHLHFEVRDSKGKYVSANPYFGYSDQGYEQCVNPDKQVSANSNCVKSDTPSARHIGQEGFAQICGKTNAYTSNASGSSNECCGTKTSTNTGNIFDFISVWEGGTGSKYQCTTNSGEKGYKAYQNSGDVLTVGPGLTGQYLGGAKKAGDCVAQSVVEANYKKAEANKRKMIQNAFSSANLTNYQEDAMVSMAYNGCASFFNNIATAAKKDSLSEIWKAMKGCVNSGTQYELGLQRRRKAEFALFVTGDYSEETAKSYKSKTWSKIEYDDYDSEGVVAKKASGTSSNTCSSVSSTSSTSDVINVAIKELESWNSYSNENQYCDAVKKYINSCGGGSTVTDYCAGFVTYALKEAGVYNSLNLPNSTCVVSDFKNSSKMTVHNAGGSYTPKPGDLFVKKDSHGNDWGHIGLVEKVEGKTIHTIEGNTDPFGTHCNKGASDGSGGTRGDGTIRRKTHVDDITHYISY